MLQHMYSVYDIKAENFLPPFTSMNNATAERQFQEAANTEGHQFQKHLSDFQLWYMGAYNTNTGEITDNEARKSIYFGAHLMQQIQSQEQDEALHAIQGGE